MQFDEIIDESNVLIPVNAVCPFGSIFEVFVCTCMSQMATFSHKQIQTHAAAKLGFDVSARKLYFHELCLLSKISLWAKGPKPRKTASELK